LTKIIISGGGTGGHVFPAISIANSIKELDSSTEFLFVGAQDRMEMEKVPAAGYKIVGLWISGFQRSLSLKNLIFPFKLIASLRKAKQIIKSFQPDLVIGVGGYASGPMLRVATKAGIPTMIQEQNSYAGVTNKILGKLADKICVAYEGMEKFFPKEKILITGNPVRKDILSTENKRQAALAHFELKEDKKIILIIGGSLGALTINQSIKASLDQFNEENIQLIWQTGKSYYQEGEEAEGETILGSEIIKTVHVSAFITEMDLAYAAADIIVSRAGAIAVSELCCVGKPVILIPSPNVAEDHQTKNAMALVEKDAAILIADKEAIGKLGDTAIALLKDSDKMQSLSENIKSLARFDAAEKIAAEALQLVSK